MKSLSKPNIKQLLQDAASGKPPKDWVPLFALVSLGLNGITIVVLQKQQGAINTLSQKPPPTLVQMRDGRNIPVEAKPADYRDPENIKEFAKTTLTLLMTWTQQPPTAQGNGNQNQASAPASDPMMQEEGVPVGEGDARITNTAWIASYALSDEAPDRLRTAFQKQIAQMMPAGVFNGETQVLPEITHVSNPAQIGPGLWQVNVVSHLNVYQRQNNRFKLSRQIEFNKQLQVKAIPVPITPANATPLLQAQNGLRSSGLEIVSMRDINPEQLEENNS